MSLKSAARTAERIMKMVESGDYDPDIIVHMTESLVKNRDKRIKYLQETAATKAKPHTFDLSLKSIAGALRDTIKMHGPITKNRIGSASKRIFGNCQRVIDENKIVPKQNEPEVVIVRDKTTTHKLTVGYDNNIRIKVAIGASNEETNLVIAGFIHVGIEAVRLNAGTLRGQIKVGDTHNKITLYNESKTEQYGFSFSGAVL